jgi:hypothetical protein
MSECMVCFEELVDYVTLPCSHELCTACYPRVKETFAKCPLCENPLLADVQYAPFAEKYARVVGCCSTFVLCSVFVYAVFSLRL